MRLFSRFFSERTNDAVAPGENLFAAAPKSVWGYSDQYGTLVGEGHRSPPPEFGTPTMIWHMGIWPRHMPGDSPQTKTERERLIKDRPEISPEDLRLEEAKFFDRDNRRFYAEVNEFLVRLQLKGRVAGAKHSELRFLQPERLPSTASTVYPFAFGSPQSVAFTLWWRDGEGPQVPPETPSPEDLRVRVLAQAQLDHATIAFYIDAGKPWGQEYLLKSDSYPGARRTKIVHHIEAMRTMAADQLRKGIVDLDKLPERGVGRPDAEQLLAAADYLYAGIWNEFSVAFGLDMWTDGGKGENAPIGERFSESRGLVLSFAGALTPKELERRKTTAELRRAIVVEPPPPGVGGSDGTIGIGAFPVFDRKAGEPNAVVKAFLPAVRRLSPNGDDRDIVACGILDWRALFISAMGSSTHAAPRDESPGEQWAVPSGHLPEPAGTANRPTRHLFITKGEPNRMQIGRFVERVNAAETLRLFALKNWATIQNAGVHLRILGRELDHVLSHWGERRLIIDRDYRERVERLPKRSVPKRRRRWGRDPSIRTTEAQNLSEYRLNQLSDLITETESKLISIGAALDNIGQGGAGRLLYLLSRSSRFIKEFERVGEMIEVGNIPTWLNYKRFIDRGLRSTFDVIGATEDTLVALRQRLQSITEVVQTGALIVEAEATRNNTQTLERIATNWWLVQVSIAGLVVTLIVQVATVIAFVVSNWETIKPLFGAL